jgi:hypothetical protein
MRIVASLFVLTLASTQARADKGASFELGYVRNQVAVTDQTALGGQSGRFGIRITLGPHIHFGGEAEEGSLAGTAGPSGVVARGGTSGSTELAGPLEGNTLGLKAYAGAHTRLGAFMVGADLAGGMRDTYVSSIAGMDVAGRKNEPLLEARTRVDFFLSTSLTIGAMASADMIERRDVSIGAVLGLHFTQ